MRNRKNLYHEAETIINGNPKYRPFLISLSTENYNQALRRACYVGATSLVKLLIRDNAAAALELDLSATTSDGRTPYELACTSGNITLSEYILEQSRQAHSKPIKPK